MSPGPEILKDLLPVVGNFQASITNVWEISPYYTTIKRYKKKMKRNTFSQSKFS